MQFVFDFCWIVYMRQDPTMQFRLSLNSLCSTDWPQVPRHSPAKASWVLGLQVYTNKPSRHIVLSILSFPLFFSPQFPLKFIWSILICLDYHIQYFLGKVYKQETVSCCPYIGDSGGKILIDSGEASRWLTELSFCVFTWGRKELWSLLLFLRGQHSHSLAPLL